MIPRKPLFLALAALSLIGPAAQAEDAQQYKDLCSNIKDAGYEDMKSAPDQIAVWKAACEPVNAAKLEEIKAANPGVYAQYLNGAPARQKIVFDLYNFLTTDPRLKDVNDDSDQNKSKSIGIAIKLGVKSDGSYIGGVTPPINERTFPAWLTPEQNKWVFPKFVIAQNANLREEKYHPEGPGPDAQRLQAINQQLEQNKVRLYQMRGISDVNQFAQFVGEGWQRADDGASGGVAGANGGAAGAAAADNRPLNPQQRLKTGAAPKPYMPGDLEKNGDEIGVGSYSVNTKSAWGLVGAAAGLVGVGLAGYVAKSKKEMAAEDTADVKEKADAYDRSQREAAAQAQAERDAKLTDTSRELIALASKKGYTLTLNYNPTGYEITVLRDIIQNAADPTNPASVNQYINAKTNMHAYGLDDGNLSAASNIGSKIGGDIAFAKK